MNNRQHSAVFSTGIWLSYVPLPRETGNRKKRESSALITPIGTVLPVPGKTLFLVCALVQDNTVWDSEWFGNYE